MFVCCVLHVCVSAYHKNPHPTRQFASGDQQHADLQHWLIPLSSLLAEQRINSCQPVVFFLQDLRVILLVGQTFLDSFDIAFQNSGYKLKRHASYEHRKNEYLLSHERKRFESDSCQQPDSRTHTKKSPNENTLFLFGASAKRSEGVIQRLKHEPKRLTEVDRTRQMRKHGSGAKKTQFRCDEIGVFKTDKIIDYTSNQNCSQTRSEQQKSQFRSELTGVCKTNKLIDNSTMAKN